MNKPNMLEYPATLVGRRREWQALVDFVRSARPEPTLGLVYGRRRVGKSFLLRDLVEGSGGFMYQAVRGAQSEALREIGAALATFSGAPAPLDLPDWSAAAGALLALGRTRPVPVVIDEFPYLLEHSPELASVLQRALDQGRAARGVHARLILCGSALSIMRGLLSGSAPLRGRAGLDLSVSPFDLRTARELHGIEDLVTAFRTYAVIGGVAAYAREMVEDDLPVGADDFERWIFRRVLSPAAPLFNEVGLLLSEDPSTSKARKLNLYHAVLAGVATGHRAHRKLTGYLRMSGASLAPIIDALVEAGLVERLDDPVREKRPTYYPADSLIRFHYAVTRRNQARLARPGVDARVNWLHLRPTFETQVVGPAFEQAAREWVTHFADAAALGGHPDHVGPSTLSLPGGGERQLDVVVASHDSEVPSERRVLALGEAKSGETLTLGHLQRLEQARDAFGGRAEGARLLLVGVAFDSALAAAAVRRGDVELVGLERLYGG